jgi:cell wall-associated NlpC family hydrolase
MSTLDVPYLYGGQTQQGTDCSGNVILILRRMGYAIEDMTADELMKKVFTLSNPADKRGTIGAIFWTENGKAVHVELLLNSKLMIGSADPDGVMVRQVPGVLQNQVVRFADMSFLIARLRDEQIVSSED